MPTPSTVAATTTTVARFTTTTSARATNLLHRTGHKYHHPTVAAQLLVVGFAAAVVILAYQEYQERRRVATFMLALLAAISLTWAAARWSYTVGGFLLAGWVLGCAFVEVNVRRVRGQPRWLTERDITVEHKKYGDAVEISITNHVAPKAEFQVELQSFAALGNSPDEWVSFPNNWRPPWRDEPPGTARTDILQDQTKTLEILRYRKERVGPDGIPVWELIGNGRESIFFPFPVGSNGKWQMMGFLRVFRVDPAARRDYVVRVRLTEDEYDIRHVEVMTGRVVRTPWKKRVQKRFERLSHRKRGRGR